MTTSKTILFIISFFLLTNSYAQKISISIDTKSCDSIKAGLKHKILNGVLSWERMSKSAHVVKGAESFLSAHDSSTDILVIPKVKILIRIDSSGNGLYNYRLINDPPIEFYAIPIPVTNDKVYAYELAGPEYKVGGPIFPNRANFVRNAIKTTNKKEIYFGYFSEIDRYWNNFLLIQKSSGNFSIIDQDLHSFNTIKDFIDYQYGNNIQNLVKTIKSRDRNISHTLWVINNIELAENQSPIIDPKNIEKFSQLNPGREETKEYKDRWKYTLIYSIKLKQGIKLLDIRNFLDKYNISQNDQKLNVCLDKHLFRNRDMLLIDPDWILKVEVINDKYTADNKLGKTEKFINIITKNLVKQM